LTIYSEANIPSQLSGLTVLMVCQRVPAQPELAWLDFCDRTIYPLLKKPANAEDYY